MFAGQATVADRRLVRSRSWCGRLAHGGRVLAWATQARRPSEADAVDVRERPDLDEQLPGQLGVGDDVQLGIVGELRVVA